MTNRAHLRRVAICARKIQHETWERAEAAGLAVWLESPRQTDANMALPYACDIGGNRHYHCGHLRFGVRHIYAEAA